MDSDGAVPMQMVHQASGAVLSMDARTMIRPAAQADEGVPPRVILHFCRRMVFPFARAVDSRYFTIVEQTYRNITDEAVWEAEARLVLGRVAADNVDPAELDLFARAFRRYTTAALARYSIAQLSAIQFFCVLVIPPIFPSMSPSETERFIMFWDEDYVDLDPIEGPAPAPEPEPAMAAEGFRMRIAEEPDSCSICLNEFNTMTHVLEMPCRHVFHNECLREWLARSNTCPLCRSRLSS